MPNSKQIVYLSQSQYAELIANGTITVNGVTVTYNENDIYVTPQAEPVTDVRINGTSVAANGVADIPVADRTVMGVGKVASDYGIQRGSGGLSDYLVTSPADSSLIKSGSAGNQGMYKPITPRYQHESTFYGLAKVAGHDEASSTESVGTYTPEAKGAIQQMLGVSDLIGTSENDLVASKAYKVGEVFTANGKLYKATAAIAADAAIIPAIKGEEIAGANCEETSVGDGFPHDVQINGVSVVSDGVANIPMATETQLGTVKPNPMYGIGIFSAGGLKLEPPTATQYKTGSVSGYRAVQVGDQHVSTFYGLAKAAGDATQAASDNAVGTYTDEAKAAIRTMLGAVGTTDYATSESAGIVKVNGSYGIVQNGGAGGPLQINYATAAQCKNRTGSTAYQPLTVFTENVATFYGLAYAAGDTTMASSSNAVGTYTDNAKASIKSMLGIVDGSTGTVDITGATPTINAVENTRYVCGEVTSLSFTPPSSGISIVRFTSGSTVTVLTIPSTVKFPEWFDPTALETNTIYEICITDGMFGAVMSWAL